MIITDVIYNFFGTINKCFNLFNRPIFGKIYELFQLFN